MSSRPLWWTRTIDFSLALFVRPPAFVHFTIVICVSRDWLQPTYYHAQRWRLRKYNKHHKIIHFIMFSKISDFSCVYRMPFSSGKMIRTMLLLIKKKKTVLNGQKYRNKKCWRRSLESRVRIARWSANKHFDSQKFGLSTELIM